MSEDLDGARYSARNLSPGWRLVLLVLLTALCFAGGKIGLLVPIVQQRVTLLWPPTGIALAAVLLCGSWVWPAITLGSLLVSFSTGTPPVAAVVIAFGNTLGALAGGWLLRRLGFRNRLERVRDLLALLTTGVVVAPLISAVIGVAALNLAWRVPSARVLQSALSWWLGDAMGVLLVTPVLLTAFARPFRPARRERVVEAATLAFCLLAAGALTLSSWSSNPVLHPPLAFTLFPFLVWAALRFGPRGAAIATFMAVAIAFWATAQGLAPFALGTVEERLMYLYSYTAVSMLTSMLLAAVFAERAQAEEGIRRSEERLRLALDAGRCGVWDWDIAGAAPDLVGGGLRDPRHLAGRFPGADRGLHLRRPPRGRRAGREGDPAGPRRARGLSRSSSGSSGRMAKCAGSTPTAGPFRTNRGPPCGCWGPCSTSPTAIRPRRSAPGCSTARARRAPRPRPPTRRRTTSSPPSATSCALR